MSRRHSQKISFAISIFLTTTLIASVTARSGFASTENNNNTLMEPEALQGMATATDATTITNTTSGNATTATPNIVLVHGLWADGSSWNRVIPILQKAGHKVIAVQLAERSLAEDVASYRQARN